MRKLLTDHHFFQIFYKTVLGKAPRGSGIINSMKLMPNTDGLLVVCLALMIAGCTTFKEAPKAPPAPVVVAPPAPPPKPTSLTAEAEGALKAAEQSIVEARVKRALWTAAIEQLTLARNAAKLFDSETTLKHAREVVALCQLSAQQATNQPVLW
jgi:hypothetical protein